MLDIHYFAGYFDGEGSIIIVRSSNPTRYQLAISMGNTYEPVLQAFKDRFGGSVYTNVKTSGFSKKPVHVWRATGKHARYFLQEITPHLLEKKGQAEYALQFPLPRKGYRWHPLTDEESRLQEAVYLKVKQLKHIS